MLLILLSLFIFNCEAMENNTENVDELKDNIKLIDLKLDNTQTALCESYYNIQEFIKYNRDNLTEEQIDKLSEALFLCIPFGED